MRMPKLFMPGGHGAHTFQTIFSFSLIIIILANGAFASAVIRAPKNLTIDQRNETSAEGTLTDINIIEYPSNATLETLSILDLTNSTRNLEIGAAEKTISPTRILSSEALKARDLDEPATPIFPMNKPAGTGGANLGQVTPQMAGFFYEGGMFVACDSLPVEEIFRRLSMDPPMPELNRNDKVARVKLRIFGRWSELLSREQALENLNRDIEFWGAGNPGIVDDLLQLPPPPVPDQPPQDPLDPSPPPPNGQVLPPFSTFEDDYLEGKLGGGNVDPSRGGALPPFSTFDEDNLRGKLGAINVAPSGEPPYYLSGPESLSGDHFWRNRLHHSDFFNGGPGSSGAGLTKRNGPSDEVKDNSEKEKDILGDLKAADIDG
ncbi:hypothetical protein TWF718_011089 [Orbilia javanica]|uniref:Uncharacterized protein n=1 Tax=Orbilia javanica TaxID=47235 RepID=A0AAN8RD65_9PEZI